MVNFREALSPIVQARLEGLDFRVDSVQSNVVDFQEAILRLDLTSPEPSNLLRYFGYLANAFNNLALTTEATVNGDQNKALDSLNGLVWSLEHFLTNLKSE